MDGSLGPVRALGNGPVYTIPQGFGTTVGTNLFHSFGRFDLVTGERADFVSDASIRNILARVTGGSASSIDGLIFTNSAAVNLFLINPNGIEFGPNARLDIGGTTRGDFTATTVDAIVWPDGSRFDAVNPGGAAPLLQIVGDPSGFLASQRQVPAISTDRSRLNVYSGQDLRLLGGDVRIVGGRLDARGGRVEIGAVAGAGLVNLLGDGRFQFSDGLARGDVRFTDQAFADVRLGNGGDLGVTGRDIGVLSGSRLLAGIDRNLGTATSQAGTVRLEATGTVTVAGAGSRVANDVRTGATGTGGDLVIRAREVVVRDGAQLTAITFGAGDAGNVRIEASDRVLFQGRSADGQFSSAAFSSVETATAVGQGGDVVIVAPVLEVRDGAQLIAGTRGTGDAGNVRISASDRVLFQNSSAAITRVEAGGVGQGGDVVIVAPVLEVRDGAQLIANTEGTGDAGNVRIEAGDRVLLQNRGAAFSSVETATAVGQGGDVVIVAPVLEVRDGAQLVASTEGTGDAGNVWISASDRVLFQNGDAFSSVEAGGVGQGGDVVIEAPVLEVRDGAQLSASTRGKGDAGNVRISASDRVLLDGTTPITGRSSGIFTSNGFISNQGIAIGGTGTGGNVFVTTPQLQVSNGAVINASTVNAQPGGAITLNLGQLTLLNGGQLLSTSDGTGPAGTVRINATDGIRIAGSDPTYADRRTQFRTAVASINANSGIQVRSTATGAAGNVIIGDQGNTPRLVLNGGEIVADSNAVNGGNITLNLDQALIMRNGSLISATAGRALGAGDGGNITITAPFVLTRPGENNDIIANAFSGTGGNITITADSILNFTVNDFKDFDTLRAQPTNDISASSQLGTQGVLNLVGLNVDPSQGVFPFRGAFSPPDQVRDLCKADGNRPGRAYTDKFIITGRGGVAETPFDTVRSLPSDPPPWVELPPQAPSSDVRVPSSDFQPPSSQPPLKEATTWRQRPDGIVELVAEEAVIVGTKRPCDLERLEHQTGTTARTSTLRS